jgi:hypothetical protein
MKIHPKKKKRENLGSITCMNDVYQITVNPNEQPFLIFQIFNFRGLQPVINYNRKKQGKPVK